MRILALNGGSSTLKCRYDDVDLTASLPSKPPVPVWQNEVGWGSDFDADLRGALGSVPGRIDAVGHRIVHGGDIRRTSFITPAVREAIAGVTHIAPEHNALELRMIDGTERVLNNQIENRERVPQIAVFDTAFHTTLEPPAYTYPGPYAWVEQGIRRFGFHGINHQYVSRRAAELLGRDSPGDALRLVSCHLGNGASLAAVCGGKCVDTTMGFTPLDGLMMGSRSGSVDPGILIHLMRTQGMTADELDKTLNKRSGLLGISGLSNDMREILAAIERGDTRAKLAFDMYAHRLVREIGAMLAVLGGADALVFTGGVGEHCAPLRQLVTNRLGVLAPKATLVIRAEEEWEIVRECAVLLSEARCG